MPKISRGMIALECACGWSQEVASMAEADKVARHHAKANMWCVLEEIYGTQCYGWS